jgi:hypothetical protein
MFRLPIRTNLLRLVQIWMSLAALVACSTSSASGGSLWYCWEGTLPAEASESSENRAELDGAEQVFVAVNSGRRNLRQRLVSAAIKSRASIVQRAVPRLHVFSADQRLQRTPPIDSWSSPLNC